MLMGVNSTLVLTWLLLMHEVRWHIEVLLATAVMLTLPIKVMIGSRGGMVLLVVRGLMAVNAVLLSSSVRGSRWWTVDSTRRSGVGDVGLLVVANFEFLLAAAAFEIR